MLLGDVGSHCMSDTSSPLLEADDDLLVMVSWNEELVQTLLGTPD